MNRPASLPISPIKDAVLPRLRLCAVELNDAANEDDQREQFPTRAIGILRETGCLAAVLPKAQGGSGLGWSLPSIDLLIDLLRGIGGVHLSAARLFEGHVNAFQLLWTFGQPAQRDDVIAYVKKGELLGVWNAPSPEGELMLLDSEEGCLLLSGPKAYASGAGGIQRPLVTARHPALGLRMVWPDMPYSVGPSSEWAMHGMRASLTRSVRFNGAVSRRQIFGEADDYHRQPSFSGGSWRFLAAQLGAAEALAERMREDLERRQRSSDTHQRTRMAQCIVALDTARKWIRDAAHLSLAENVPADVIVIHASKARVVVERALLDVMELVHRSIGLQSFNRASPMERIARDLATYLRQPAPDALLDAIGVSAFAERQNGLLAGCYGSE